MFPRDFGTLSIILRVLSVCIHSFARLCQWQRRKRRSSTAMLCGSGNRPSNTRRAYCRAQVSRNSTSGHRTVTYLQEILKIVGHQPFHLCPHSSPMPHSLRRNSVLFIDASSCLTSFVLIHFALPPVLRSAGLCFISHMHSSLVSAAALHSLRSTGTLLRFSFQHCTILCLFLSLVQRCGSLP